ncbi:hypothetical protein PV11_05815 [Exophiala sideris]|uniref:Peptidase S33 tripeptidyl aminopeptidase-like C-terminal domain-containing protein n=1 Tax=Exophiala sideris TaxID=1016849 RepID=A0A0D1YR05_9EURO|nr:hypothetical protein PV11_05815 [Exophiala sideris]
MLLLSVLLATAVGQVAGLPPPQSRRGELETHIGDSDISWSTDCAYLGFDSQLPYSCANFSVPLDYTDPTSNETLELTLTRINATIQPARGSVLFNPGGPGAGGADFITGGGEEFMTVLGGQFNLIGFDPRATGNTLRFDCNEGLSDLEQLEAQPPPTVLGNASDVALGNNFASIKAQAAQCLNRTGGIGELVGTAFVARDMARIVDALGEDGLLRYWGFSYGTALGATFSAMFPEKVDKVVLDGNVNVQEYYSGWYGPDLTIEKRLILTDFHRETQALVDLDGVVQGFFDGCIASPDSCPLARAGETADDVYNTVEAMLTRLKYNPIAVTLLNETTVVTYSSVKTFMFNMLYRPRTWPLVATLLDYLVDDNASLYVDARSQLRGNGTAGDSPDAITAIRCGDTAFRTDSLADLMPFEQQVVPTSTWGGLDFGLDNIMNCAPWMEKAKEVYSGDWDIKTKNPLLLIGNTYDPVTPLVSAQNNSAAFPGSVVLQHNGYGHTSLAQPSLCTAEAVQAYFINGTLPAPGTICQPDVPLFSNSTWQDAFASISLNGTVKAKRNVRYGSSSKGLMEALTELSRNVPGKPEYR